MKGRKTLSMLACAALLQACWLPGGFAERIDGTHLTEPTLVAEIPLHGTAADVAAYDDGAFLLTGSQTPLTVSVPEASPAQALRIDGEGATQWQFEHLMGEQSYATFNEGFALGENYALALEGADANNSYSQLLLVKDQEIVKREELSQDWIYQFYQAEDRLLRFGQPRDAQYEAGWTNRELSCYDSELNLLWQAEYDLPLFLSELLPLEDGYLLVGRLQEPDEGGAGPSQGFVGKLDAAGTLETYQTVEEYYLQFEHAMQTKDGGYLALGVCEDMKDQRAVHMTVFDSSLNATDTKHMALSGNSLWLMSNMVPVENGFVVAFAEEPEKGHITLHAYDDAGNLLDSLAFAVDCKFLSVCSLRSNDQGIFLFVGALKPLEENDQENRWWTLMYKLNGVP